MKHTAEHRVACGTENRRLRWLAAATGAVLLGATGGWLLTGFDVEPPLALGLAAAAGAISGWLFGPRAWALAIL